LGASAGPVPTFAGMARKTETVEIGGNKYEITQLGATLGGEVMFRLGRAFGAILAGLKTGNLTVDTLDPADFNWLVQVMIPSTKVGMIDVKGKGDLRWHPLKVDFDDHFAGRYPQMMEWLKSCLEVNYGPLQGTLGSIFRGVAALSVSTPQTVSTGSPGDSSSAPDSRSDHSQSSTETGA
jgi:hypothetical protein